MRFAPEKKERKRNTSTDVRTIAEAKIYAEDTQDRSEREGERQGERVAYYRCWVSASRDAASCVPSVSTCLHSR